VFDFGNLNRLEVPCFGNASHIPQGRGVMFPSLPGGAVKLAAEDSQVGGPRGFGVVGRS